MIKRQSQTKKDRLIVKKKSIVKRYIITIIARNTATKDAAISVSGNTSVKSGSKRERIWSARPAARLSRPNDPMPYIAVMPAVKKRTDKMLRMMLSAHFEHLALSVTELIGICAIC